MHREPLGSFLLAGNANLAVPISELFLEEEEET